MGVRRTRGDRAGTGGRIQPDDEPDDEPQHEPGEGNHDWLTGRPAPDLLAEEEKALFPLEAAAPVRLPAPPVDLTVEPVVHTMIKADLRCAAVAAASVLAKVERDRIMVERAQRFP